MGNLSLVLIFHNSDLQYCLDFSVYAQIHEFQVFTLYSMCSMRWVIGHYKDLLGGYPLLDSNLASISGEFICSIMLGSLAGSTPQRRYPSLM